MKILLHRGTGLVSRLIRWQTRSAYSHAGLLMDDGRVVEAWWPRVRLTPCIGAGHPRCERIDVFVFADPLTALENRIMEMSARKLVGRPYDWQSVARFLTRERSVENRRLFCSELVFEVCHKAGRELLSRTQPWRVPPDWIARSPLLEFEKFYLA
ncbi:MAG: hypothetical protein KGL39_46400 [Patescibacteria group bacterium]|nr:hypothetical protein [Patescibacteria group bacterium]